MKKIFVFFVLAALPVLGSASGGGGCGKIACDDAGVDLSDRGSLQRGARIFVNYCLSCHSASYMRYNRLGKDLGISEELVEENLLFAADKVGDLMKAVMPPEDAKKWFGTAPPDLSTTARSRGPDWIYTYMRAFYRDHDTVSGWNNAVFESVAMPHVLYEWQGEQRVAAKAKDAKHGSKPRVADYFEISRAGSKSVKEFDREMRDLVNFMVYLAEPAKLVRYKIGIYVILFLIVFTFVAYLLKKEYWKDIH